MDTPVRVAVRIRPQTQSEIKDLCKICTAVTPNEPQITVDNRAFTFDYVFDTTSKQDDIYEAAVSQLVEDSLKGYNATVLAYGQTGSGKTYTMGTSVKGGNTEHEGIIPRAVRHMFAGIEKIQGECVPSSNFQYKVTAQFVEVHNNNLIDLLDPKKTSKANEIREDMAGRIHLDGAKTIPLNGPNDAMNCLRRGLLARTTGWTQLNAHSSRSHALFMMQICRQRVISSEGSHVDDLAMEMVTSKFHFVDLAGSERLKRTGATDERAKESISINCGLFALGNVISALGNKSLNGTHVPYRNSKLTRLLQDSLGGNSKTLMIACISPSDRDASETINTLKYANRARNIKNHAEINKDAKSRLISSLRRQIEELQAELAKYKNNKSCDNSDVKTSMEYLSTVLEEADNNLEVRKVAFQKDIIQSEADSNKSTTDLIQEIFKDIRKLQTCIAQTIQKVQMVMECLPNATDLRDGLNCKFLFPDASNEVSH